MKKILAFMTAIVLVVTSGVGVVSCIPKSTEGWPKLESGKWEQIREDEVLYDHVELIFSIVSAESDRPAFDANNYTFKEVPSNGFNVSIKQTVKDDESLKINYIGEGGASADQGIFYLTLSREVKVGYYLNLTFDNKTINTAVVPTHKKKDNGKIAGAIIFNGSTDKCDGRDIRISFYNNNIVMDPSRFKLLGDFIKWNTTLINMKFAKNAVDWVVIDANLKNKPNKIDPNAHYLISYTNGEGVTSQGKVNQTEEACWPL